MQPLSSIISKYAENKYYFLYDFYEMLSDKMYQYQDTYIILHMPIK